jgi:hypothetical protein
VLCEQVAALAVKGAEQILRAKSMPVHADLLGRLKAELDLLSPAFSPY